MDWLLGGTGKDWAPVPVRLILGAGFMVHGYPKLFTSKGHRGVADRLSGFDVPLPELTAWTVGIFFGGLMLILGALVALVSVFGLLNMLGAMFLVHWSNGFKFSNRPPGIEVNLLYIAGFLMLILGGAGVLSVDHLLRERRHEPRR
jgi:putative oxidoreductase